MTAAGWRLPHDWFPALVPENVHVAADAWVISSHLFVHCRSRMPAAVTIGPSSGVYEGCAFAVGPEGTVEIGAYVSLVQTIVSTNSRIVIGDHALIAYGTVIADTPFALPPREYLDGPPPAGAPVVIGNNVWIGAKSFVLGGAEIGDDSVIGAGSVVSGPVPSGVIAAGNPCRVVGSVR